MTNAGKRAERCGTCQEFAKLFAEECGFGPNHEICCICRITIWAVDVLQEVVKYQGVVDDSLIYSTLLGVVRVESMQKTNMIMESTAGKVQKNV